MFARHEKFARKANKIPLKNYLGYTAPLERNARQPLIAVHGQKPLWTSARRRGTGNL
jgi:hypothetical protein